MKMHASLLGNGRNLRNSYEAVLLKLYIAPYNVRLLQIYDSDGRTYNSESMITFLSRIAYKKVTDTRSPGKLTCSL